jgi:SAM-dependent methyltransferase
MLVAAAPPPLDYTIYYRAWHDESPEHAGRMAKYFTNVLSPHLNGSESKPAIDIGCGMGFAMLALQQMGYVDVRGIDLDSGQIAVAKAHGLHAEQVSDAAAYLQEHPATFGTILLLDVLEHVPVAEQVSLLRAIHSALIPGGRLIVQVPNANAILASRWRYNDYTHHSSFTEHSLRFVLLNAGFTGVEIAVNPRSPRPSLRLWKRPTRHEFLPGLRRYLIDLVWRSVLKNELGEFEKTELIPTTLNMRGVAVR